MTSQAENAKLDCSKTGKFTVQLANIFWILQRGSQRMQKKEERICEVLGSSRCSFGEPEQGIDRRAQSAEGDLLFKA